MDDGYTIVGLNEGWTLGGAKLMEWTSGFVMAMVVSELLRVNLATSGPLMIMLVLGTTFGLAAARKQFPDEERGLRNSVMVNLGFEPPGIPAPSVLRPYWSGAPLRALSEKSYFETLKLSELFNSEQKIERDLGSIFLQRASSSAAVVTTEVKTESQAEISQSLGSAR